MKEKEKAIQTQETNNKIQNNPDDKKKIIVHEGFFKTLKETKKYKDMCTSTEGIISIICGIISTALLYTAVKGMNIDQINEMIRSISGIAIGGVICLLGIVISVLSFTAGSMNVKITQKIVDDKKIKHLIKIFFSFEFIGAIMGIEIFCLTLAYFSSYTNFIVTDFRVILIGFILFYLFWFSIWYCIGLLGTCINVFLLNYNLDDKQ